MLKRH